MTTLTWEEIKARHPAIAQMEARIRARWAYREQQCHACGAPVLVVKAGDHQKVIDRASGQPWHQNWDPRKGHRHHRCSRKETSK